MGKQGSLHKVLLITVSGSKAHPKKKKKNSRRLEKKPQSI